MNQQSLEIAVIINSFNRLTLLKESLTSLYAAMSHAQVHFSIVIFDAGSKDGSIEWIQQFMHAHQNIHCSLIIAKEGEDASFSAGVNKACEYAINHFPALKYLMLYETDNVLKSEKPIIETIYLLSSDSDFAACGFTVKKHNGTYAGFGARFPGLLSFILGQQLSFFLKLHEPHIHWRHKEAIKYTHVEVVYTSPLIIKKEIWQSLNGLDAVHFPFSECDTDLAYRVSRLGKRMVVIASEEVIHDNRSEQSEWSSQRVINYYRARFKYFKKHYGDIIHLYKPLLFLMHCTEFLILLILAVIGKRKWENLCPRWFLMKTVFFNYK